MHKTFFYLSFSVILAGGNIWEVLDFFHSQLKGLKHSDDLLTFLFRNNLYLKLVFLSPEFFISCFFPPQYLLCLLFLDENPSSFPLQR